MTTQGRARPSVKHLEHPPIVEAVLEVQFGNIMPIDLPRIIAALQVHFPDYTGIQHESQAEFQFSVGSAQSPSASSQDLGVTGVLIRSEDTKRICRFGRQGFMFSQLAPYPGWESFSANALALWNEYRSLISPKGSARVGLRTINRIPFAVGADRKVDLATVFTAPPTDLPFVAWDRVGLFIAETFSVSGSQVMVQLVRSFERGDQGPFALVDIDASEKVDGIETLELVALAKELHAAKNEAFFSTVSEAVLRSFE